MSLILYSWPLHTWTSCLLSWLVCLVNLSSRLIVTSFLVNSGENHLPTFSSVLVSWFMFFDSFFLFVGSCFLFYAACFLFLDSCFLIHVSCFIFLDVGLCIHRANHSAVDSDRVSNSNTFHPKIAWLYPKKSAKWKWWYRVVIGCHALHHKLVFL